MSKKKKQNRKIRDSYETITLKELIDRGECSPFHHLKEVTYIGGLIVVYEN